MALLALICGPHTAAGCTHTINPTRRYSTQVCPSPPVPLYVRVTLDACSRYTFRPINQLCSLSTLKQSTSQVRSPRAPPVHPGHQERRGSLKNFASHLLERTTSLKNNLGAGSPRRASNAGFQDQCQFIQQQQDLSRRPPPPQPVSYSTDSLLQTIQQHLVSRVASVVSASSPPLTPQSAYSAFSAFNGSGAQNDVVSGGSGCVLSAAAAISPATSLVSVQSDNRLPRRQASLRRQTEPGVVEPELDEHPVATARLRRKASEAGSLKLEKTRVKQHQANTSTEQPPQRPKVLQLQPPPTPRAGRKGASETKKQLPQPDSSASTSITLPSTSLNSMAGGSASTRMKMRGSNKKSSWDSGFGPETPLTAAPTAAPGSSSNVGCGGMSKSSSAQEIQLRTVSACMPITS